MVENFAISRRVSLKLCSRFSMWDLVEFLFFHYQFQVLFSSYVIVRKYAGNSVKLLKMLGKILDMIESHVTNGTKASKRYCQYYFGMPGAFCSELVGNIPGRDISGSVGQNGIDYGLWLNRVSLNYYQFKNSTKILF